MPGASDSGRRQAVLSLLDKLRKLHVQCVHASPNQRPSARAVYAGLMLMSADGAPVDVQVSRDSGGKLHLQPINRSVPSSAPRDMSV